MIILVIVSAILLILDIILLTFLNKRTHEKEFWEKQEKRAWMLKVALEKSGELPTVEPTELERIEPQLDQLMNQAGNPAMEEKIRQLIMSLYEEKRERLVKDAMDKEAAKKEAAKKEALNLKKEPPRQAPPSRPTTLPPYLRMKRGDK